MHVVRSHRQRWLAAGFALLSIVALATMPASAESSGPGFIIIVNPANKMGEIDSAYLGRIFLKKVTHWPDGEAIRPVDLGGESAVRRHFDEEILGRSVAGIRNQWQQAIFAGRDVPPPELDSDAEVVDFVLKYPGAIGYVSPHADVKTARVVAIR